MPSNGNIPFTELVLVNIPTGTEFIRLPHSECLNGHIYILACCVSLIYFQPDAVDAATQSR